MNGWQKDENELMSVWKNEGMKKIRDKKGVYVVFGTGHGQT